MPMTIDQLMRLTVKDLRALAERHGLAGTLRWRKDQLIGALEPLLGKLPLPMPATALASGSSATTAAVVSACVDSNAGLPIPDRYGIDRLVLLVQDPFHVFAYWEITADTYRRFAALAGQGYAQVLLIHGPQGCEQREVDFFGGNYYLSVAPGTSYRAELALRTRDGRLLVLAASQTVATPAIGPSQRSDATWMEVDGAFHDLLGMAGLPGADGSSLARLAARTLTTTTWDERDLLAASLSSGELSRRAAKHLQMPLSSANLSSHSLSSHSLSSTSPIAP